MENVKVIKETFEREKEKLDSLSVSLDIPFSAEALLELSAITYEVYQQKGYLYIKVNATRTGEKAEKIEVWKKRGSQIRRRTETFHVRNYPYNPAVLDLLREFVKCWRRCKGLKKYLENL